MSIEFLKPILGDELYNQVSEKLNGVTGINIANIADGSYIPKAKFDDERTKSRGFQAQVADLTAKLNDATSKLGNVDDLNAQITKLTKDIADRDDKLSNVERDYEIKDALRTAKARDVDIVFSLLDRGKITKKDGKLDGIDDQLKSIRESRAFLFEDDNKPQNRGGFGGGRQDIIGDGSDDSASNSAVNSAIRAMAGRS